MALTAEQIKASKGKLKTEEVHVPEWATEPEDGGPVDDVVIVRELTGARRDYFEQSLQVQRPKFGADRGGVQEMESVPALDNITARFVAEICVDENGALLFTPGDAIVLGELSSEALNRVYKVGARLSGMEKDDAEAAKGNSEAGLDAGSTSDSPTDEVSTSTSFSPESPLPS